MIRILAPGDEERLERFLKRHSDSSQFLRSNMLAVGLRDEGGPLHATYVAAFHGDDVIGVVAHAWNGNLLLQAPNDAGDLARRAVVVTGRKIAGVLGPWGQVTEVLTALALDEADVTMCSREDLFALSLADLHVPEPLERATVACRRATLDEVELLSNWRTSYRIETLGESDRPDLAAVCLEEVSRSQQTGALFVLADQRHIVSTCAFNARLSDCVQIGAVWTPPQLRARGFGRSVVAGALLIARSEGVTRSILFTGEDNVAARKAYLSLGYTRVGDYGLVLFRDPQPAPDFLRRAPSAPR